MVLPMSPRLASAMTRSPAPRAASSTVSRAAIPAEPHRSKNATWGLITGTTPAKASTHRSAEPAEPRPVVAQAPLPPGAAGTGRCRRTAVRSRPPRWPPGPEALDSGLTHVPLLVNSATRRTPRREHHRSSSSRTRTGARGSRNVAVPDLDGVGPGHDQLHGVPPGHHPAHPDDGGVRDGRPARRRRPGPPPGGWPGPTGPRRPDPSRGPAGGVSMSMAMAEHRVDQGHRLGPGPAGRLRPPRPDRPPSGSAWPIGAAPGQRSPTAATTSAVAGASGRTSGAGPRGWDSSR